MAFYVDIVGRLEAKVSLRGNARTEDLSKSKCISVYEKEISRVSEVNEELSTASAVLDNLSKENDNLQKRYKSLSKETGRLQGSIKQNEKELESVKENYQEELNKNRILNEYIEKMGIPENCAKHWKMYT